MDIYVKIDKRLWKSVFKKTEQHSLTIFLVKKNLMAKTFKVHKKYTPVKFDN